MDITQLTKIQRFSNWMDRKPRAWLLFVLSAGVMLLGYDDHKARNELQQCQQDKATQSTQYIMVLYNLINQQQIVNAQKKDTVQEVHSVLQKAKQTIEEVKKKL